MPPAHSKSVGGTPLVESLIGSPLRLVTKKAASIFARRKSADWLGESGEGTDSDSRIPHPASPIPHPASRVPRRQYIPSIPPGSERMTIGTVAIIGAGIMGRRITFGCVIKGVKVQLFDSAAATL